MIAVRPVQAQEWLSYKALRLGALQESPDAFGSTYEAEAARADEFWIERMKAAANSDTNYVLFAEKDGVPCGLIWCVLSSTDAQTADIYQMWVAPQWRGLRVGYLLLDDAVKWAEQHGASQVRLGVTKTNVAAITLYENYGFQASGEVEPLRDDSPLMVQGMTLHIRA